MKHGSPLESPKDLFHQNQQSKCLQVPRINPNVIRNLGVNFEDLMPAHSDPTSPNFQKINDLLKSPSFVGSRPISMILPEFSQNSCIIPLPDNCLETSMPFEDLVGQLESPKLSDKMQMIFNSNVNLSESIMKNTFRAVDESRVKLEDKDLQVELEIRELKLHHLQKRVEGCLASSKNTLALNAQLSQNVSRMVSPTKSTNDVLSSNIKRRTSSRLHSPAGNIENSPAPVNYQLASSRSDTSSTSKARPKSVNHTTDRRQEEIKDRSFPTIKDNYGENEIAPQEESPNFKRDGRIIEREVTSASDKNVRSVSLPPKDFNSHSNHSIINEAYQKLSSYYDPRDTKKAELSNQVPQPEIGLEAVKVKSSHHKSTESIASNNITFYTNLPDKDAQIDGEEQNRILTRLQSNDCLSEDQESAQRSQFLFHSKSRETISAPLERKMNNMPREISLIDADGKERIFTIRPKELLSFQKLETICIAPLENKGLGFTKHRIRSQLSSFQLSETEEFSQLNEHLKSTQDQPIVGLHSKKASFYDNSNIASMNLDKHEYKTSGFCTAAQYEPQSEIDDLSNQKDFYAENLKSQIFNHPKCQKFFKREDLKQSNGESIGNNYLNIPPQENEGLEFYFKQKIQDCREFLDEVEKFLPTGSPIKESLRKRKKVRTAINEELPRSNRDYETARKGYSENVDLEIKTVDNTPRVPTDENIEFMRVKHNTSTKKAFSEVGYLTEQSPQNNNINIQNNNAQFESDNEFVPKQLFKENNENPYSVQTNYIVRKPNSSSNIESVKKKTKSMKNANQKQGASKISKVGKNHRSIAFPLDQNSEPVKKKTHDKTSSMKSPSQQISSKKSREIVSPGFVEIKKPKDKNLLRASSKSNVEIINLAKAQPRTNGVFIISQGH